MGWKRTSCIAVAILTAVSANGMAQVEKQKQDDLPNDTKHFVALQAVVATLQDALASLNLKLKDERSKDASDLRIKSAEFDFQAVTTNDAKGGLIVSLLTAEAEHEKDITKEIDFTYSVPTPVAPPSSNGGNKNLDTATVAANLAWIRLGWFGRLWDSLHTTATPEELNKTLPGALIAAIDADDAVKKVIVKGGQDLTHRTFVVTLSFAITNSFNSNIDASKFLIVGPEGKYTRQAKTVQTLKITFEDQ